MPTRRALQNVMFALVELFLLGEMRKLALEQHYAKIAAKVNIKLEISAKAVIREKVKAMKVHLNAIDVSRVNMRILPALLIVLSVYKAPSQTN